MTSYLEKLIFMPAASHLNLVFCKDKNKNKNKKMLILFAIFCKTQCEVEIQAGTCLRVG